MTKVTVKCAHCGQEFQREKGRYNEAKKRGWNQYCSRECQDQGRTKQITKECGNPGCDNIVSRQKCEYEKSKSGKIFCSQSCAAIYNNAKYASSQPEMKECDYCGSTYINQGSKYCSHKCKLKDLQEISKESIIKQIKKFYEKHERIPTKREFQSDTVASKRFGSWNKAIKAAGFDPNPVLFAKKRKARDGHECDSLSEKIIDNWLFSNNLAHKINVPYPENSSLTCDFLVKNYFIEFFGLEGVNTKYTKLVQRKRKIAKTQELDLIELKPKHLFPEPKLESKLSFLL